MPFIVNTISFPIEMGDIETEGRVDLSVSQDGGQTFGNNVGIKLNNLSKRQNMFKFYNLGRFNEITFQFRFYGKGRFVVTDGILEILQ